MELKNVYHVNLVFIQLIIILTILLYFKDKEGYYTFIEDGYI